MNRQDTDYIKKKMKKIKAAKKRGDDIAAEKHARELLHEIGYYNDE